jgi:hypothetical protein
VGTKKPASPTAVVAAGRQCLRPPLPQLQGLIERYPRMSRESIIAAAAPTVTRSLMPHGLPSHAHNAASAAKTRAQESLLVGANRYHDFKRPKCPTHCWSTQAPAFADRHCCGCLMSALLGFPGRRSQEGTDPPKPGLSIVARSRTGRFGLLGSFQAGMAKLKGSDIALGTTTRFGTPSLVLVPGAANWT